ncbi:unnamed protein product [Rotaria socialis]|uniref:Uncharacterized protein n=1 Tax=Rotaria socialis TaxID=392032 RepID=A0A818UGZ2_9BILA|nr:unnamed protein product [Rotaria socialis]CAF3318266.1 unnamed protein product [Rotaria socialis]CAF3325815.1 unnamed protein product [Rotaria socialis]CAF3667877.1 unnamed protein product [Rotaria socialis]CAF3693044.1 unnamed protein product [Rotaria socialis]
MSTTDKNLNPKVTDFVLEIEKHSLQVKKWVKLAVEILRTGDNVTAIKYLSSAESMSDDLIDTMNELEMKI